MTLTSPPARQAFRARAVREKQAQILRDALAAVGHPDGAGPRALVFDLDSTLLDNRPRQARIVREYAALHGEPRLADCPPEKIVSWDLRDTARLCGCSREEAEELYPALKEFWRARFFTSEYCADDVAIPGAAEFLSAALGAGARIIYVTGRHVGMGAGTVESFRRAGFPLPSWPLGPGHPESDAPVQLWLKPDPEGDDDAWKERCHAQLAAQRGIAAAFDNEPTHVNGYKKKFAEARVVHLDTDHSGRAVVVLESIPSVLDFAMDP
jgi:hypothetical protein